MNAAAAAAKSLQSCPTLCDPVDGSPPGSPILGILQARTLEWVAISFSNAWKWKVKVSLSKCPTLHDPMDYSLPGSSVHGFSRQEYWSGVPFSNFYVQYFAKRMFQPLWSHCCLSSHTFFLFLLTLVPSIKFVFLFARGSTLSTVFIPCVLMPSLSGLLYTSLLTYICVLMLSSQICFL